MATQEDFSFPTTTDPPPRFIESPRLWRTTSLISPPHESNIIPDEENDGEFNFLYQYSSKKKFLINSMHRHQRKSFSHIECGVKSTSPSEDGDQCIEEKMDMLWEDFNEEFSRNLPKPSSSSSSSTRDDSDHFHHSHHHHHRMSPGRMLNFGCVHSLKLSKPNKKPSIVVFMKVLKKMLTLQNSHRAIKKSHQGVN